MSRLRWRAQSFSHCCGPRVWPLRQDAVLVPGVGRKPFKVRLLACRPMQSGLKRAAQRPARSRLAAAAGGTAPVRCAAAASCLSCGRTATADEAVLYNLEYLQLQSASAPSPLPCAVMILTTSACAVHVSHTRQPGASPEANAGLSVCVLAIRWHLTATMGQGWRRCSWKTCRTWASWAAAAAASRAKSGTSPPAACCASRCRMTSLISQAVFSWASASSRYLPLGHRPCFV